MDNSQLSTRALTRETALQLMLQGDRPSAKRIHTLIGRGSLATIQDELTLWWKEIGERLSDASDNLPEPVMQLAKASWELALKNAHQELRNHSPVAGAALLELRDNLATAKELEQNLMRSLHAAEAVNEELRAQVEHLRKTSTIAQEDVIQARAFHKEQIALAEARFADMENRLMVQLDEARQGKKAAEEQLRRYRVGLQPQ